MVDHLKCKSGKVGLFVHAFQVLIECFVMINTVSGMKKCLMLNYNIKFPGRFLRRSFLINFAVRHRDVTFDISSN